MLIAWAAMLIFALHASTRMVGAGDTWVAMACGRHFINHGVDTVEPFSANSHHAGPTEEEVKTWPKWAQWLTNKVGLDTVKYWHPTGWVNQNWLTHVTFYWLTHLSPFADAEQRSFDTLVYWKFTLYILTVICVYYTGRVLGVNPTLAAAFACAAMFIGRSFLDIRPAGFSNLLVAVFMLVLVLATYRSHLYIWLIVPMTAFWANVHGGYIYVFIMLVPVVVLRLLSTLGRRATVSVYSILTWFALYVMSYKYTSHEPFTALPPLDDKFLFLIVALMVAGFVMERIRSVNPAAFYGYHIIVSLIVFSVLFARLFQKDMVIYSEQMYDFVHDSRQSFVMAFIAAAGLGAVVTLLKDRLVLCSRAAIRHTVAAGFVSLVAAILFNPLHLTNLTHTFVISISQHAEGWRNVHEWWPAFKWDNPVGTAFPFMVMMIVAAGLLVLWLFSRLLMPRQLKAGRGGMDRQERRFDILSRILGFAASVLVFWAVLISLSMTDVSVWSLLMAGLFVGVLWAAVFVHVHFIHLVIPLALFALYTAENLPGYSGRYIFPFITVPSYVAMFAIGRAVSKKPVFWIGNIFYVLLASVVALLLSAWIIDPFDFKEPVWHVEQFVGLHRLWRPSYEANLNLNYKNLFGVLYGLSGVCVLGWAVAVILSPMFVEKANGRAPRAASGRTYELPKIDLALITVSALTIYMAYRSRRFIPIAALVTCPIAALFTEGIIKTVAAVRNYYGHGYLDVPEMSRGLRRFLTVTALLVVSGLGIRWGCKFKYIYLDPWPGDYKLTSMFMRMTASSAKPFYACEFIRLNKLKGKMFNYWTEGGFIAYGQDPDPNTGKTPLQLFMDGRAQAAYDYKAFLRWSEISAGGQIAMLAQIRKQKLTSQQYVQIGEYVNKKLKDSNVWVVLMPFNQFSSAFVRGLEQSTDWQLVFLGDKQRLFVDVTTPEGLKLLEGIENGSTIYPDEQYRNIMVSNNALMFGRDTETLGRGLKCAIEATEEQPERTPLEMLEMYYHRFPEFREELNAFWVRYLDKFTANKESYLKQDGVYNRVMCAIVAIKYLQPVAQMERNGTLLEQYAQQQKELEGIIKGLKDKRW